jgi:MYXO-CTERM domain-containing protein
MVAGAAAILFQADPTLSPRRMRERLRVTAHDDGSGFSQRQGFGQLDLEAAARYAQGARGSAVSASRSSVGVSRDALAPGDDITTVTVVPRDETGLPVGPGHAVTIDLSAGAAVGPVSDTGEGRYERAFRAHAPRGTVAVVRATADGVTLAAHPSVFIVLDRSEIGSPFHAGGGCAIDDAPRGAWAVAMLLLALVLNSRRRRRPATLDV